GTADDLFGGSGLVDVRGVPEGDAQLDRLPEERLGDIISQRPLVGAFGGRIAVAHAAQCEAADLQPAGTQTSQLHAVSLLRHCPRRLTCPRVCPLLSIGQPKCARVWSVRKRSCSRG